MLRIRVSAAQCRHCSSVSSLRSVQLLRDAATETFSQEAFKPAVPALLPRSHFASLPAVQKWFKKREGQHSIKLNLPYISRFGATTLPLELTNDGQFARIDSSIGFFVEYIEASESERIHGTADTMPVRPRLYLAQVSLTDLPSELRDDVPTPELVLKTDKGDLYDSSIWLGQAPTYTPLHRDPNPNLFVQLAGKKIVRLFEPHVGNAIFSRVQEKVHGTASATMRGEEMMQGVERRILEEEVWGDQSQSRGECWEASLDGGDGLFIPKGWWHSIKGLGEDMNGSVSLPVYATDGFFTSDERG